MTSRTVLPRPAALAGAAIAPAGAVAPIAGVIAARAGPAGSSSGPAGSTTPGSTASGSAASARAAISTVVSARSAIPRIARRHHDDEGRLPGITQISGAGRLVPRPVANHRAELIRPGLGVRA